MSNNDRFYVYILSSWKKVLYIGSTNNLDRRMYEHKSKQFGGFTAIYNVNRLVYYEEYLTDTDAFNRERQLKGWLRIKKTELIEKENPEWNDLSADWTME